MKNGRLQAKDLSERAILEALYPHQGRWSTWCGNGEHMPNIKRESGYEAVPRKLWLAKMRSMMRRGLVGGCGCGCRGDYEITDTGLAAIERPRLQRYSGY